MPDEPLVERPPVERPPVDQGRAANRAWWDEAAPLHAAGAFYDLPGFIAGREELRPFELIEMGPVDGLDLCHLQCHLGTDTLAWARHGARVVGLDFSAPAVEAARRLALDCGVAAEFVCADVYDAAAELGGRRFDIVYTGIGALAWLPDMNRWAEVVAGLLRPGGFVYLVEIHPTVHGLAPDGVTLAEDMLDAAYRAWDDDEPAGTYGAPDAVKVHTTTWERTWAISEVVTAVIAAGLQVELLGEQDVTNVPLPWLEQGPDRLYRLPAGMPRYPLTWSLRARRPGG
jgi:2-polyprenyl-3-methyl-5-hydroxy-6-metoxy-1,4-benzoquinol methylase